ncbi:amidohydrolase family protein [Rhodococcus pyridinivorans]|uniref:amidohydrolase family protein n=1 Tax=Rhodococcus pyridinivorans TaxID=103816 RepID=UPI000761FA9E|nr:amidohydrolase family protein [Rhodococcus pyridinivorans]
MKSFVLHNASLQGHTGLWTVTVDHGRVSTIAPTPTDTIPTPESHSSIRNVDLGGHLLLPGMVDIHIHLDKAYQLVQLEELSSGRDQGIDAALALSALLRNTLTLDTIADNARRVLDTLISGGTVAARVHVEIGPNSDPATVRMHRDLADEYPDLLLQLTAFAQYGTTTDPNALQQLEQALDDGCSVVAGCPYADADPIRHLDQMIALAKDRNLPLDLHLDLSDDPHALLLDEVVMRVEKAELQGQVLVGHVTTLTALSPERVRELATAAAGAGIAVAAIPSTDLYLSGRTTDTAPTRGVTRIAELLDAHVPVCLASNNYENAFTPVTMPSLTHAAWLASLTNHMGSTTAQLKLLDAISAVPRTLLGPDVPGLAVGDVVGAAVFDTPSPVDVVRRAARPIALVSAHHGLRAVDRTPADFTEGA